MKYLNHSLILAISSGILLGAGSRFSVLWWCSLFAFVPLMVVLYRVQNVRLLFLYTAITGMITYGLSFHSLFWDSLPISWLGVEGSSGVFLIIFIWSITVVLFATIFAAVITITGRFVLSRSFMGLLIVPSAYVLAEWIATWGFSIVHYGPFGLFGPNFTMGSPAYQLASDAALLQFSWFGGVYALGFIQAFTGVCLYRLYISTHKLERKIICAVLVCLLLYVVGINVWLSRTTSIETDTPISVALIYTNGPSVLAPNSVMLSESYAKFSSLVESISSDSIDIIALPEDSRYLSQWHRLNPAIFGTSSSSHKSNALIIDSASEREDGVLYSRTEYFDSEKNTSVYSYKQFLMPLGEEHPYVYQFLLRLIGHSKLVDTLRDIRGFHTKPEVNQSVTNDKTRVVALLCSEGMSPKLYADQARKGAEVFFNLASHSWFHQSHTMHTLSVWNGKVRAVESRRWYARPANDSPAFILDAFGREIVISDWGTEGVLYGTVYARTDVTPYMIFGQYVLIIPLCIVLFAYVRRNKIA